MLMLAVIKVMPMALSRSIQPPCSASTYNMLSMFRLIPGALQTIFQFAILDYAWLPYDGLLSVPVYAVRAYSAILMMKAVINVAVKLAPMLGGLLGRFF